LYITATFVIGSDNLQDLNANFSMSQLIHKRGFQKAKWAGHVSLYHYIAQWVEPWGGWMGEL